MSIGVASVRMDPTPAAGLQPGQPVRVTGRGHLSRCGTVAFIVGADSSLAEEVWVDFGAGELLRVDPCMVEPIVPTERAGVVDPVSGGLVALRTSWPSLRRGDGAGGW